MAVIFPGSYSIRQKLIMIKLKQIGYWSSMLSLIFAIAYSVSQLLSEAKLIPHPQDLYWFFAPSLFLAPSFLIAMICLHYKAGASKRLFTAISVAFAILYCANVSLVYFSELVVVLPAQLKNDVSEKQVLLFDRRTFLMAVDCLGYFFMSLSTLFAAFAFQAENKWLYRGLLYNGLLLPVLILAFFLSCILLYWRIVDDNIPMAMINAAKLFRPTSHVSALGFKIN
jgi:hypothetical protein